MLTDTIPARFTDEALEADLTAEAAGPRRRAEILLRVPAEARALCSADAHRRGNLIGGRPSDNLRSAADAYLRGALTEESYRAAGEELRYTNWR